MIRYEVRGFISGHVYSQHRKYRAAFRACSRFAKADRVVPWTYYIRKVA